MCRLCSEIVTFIVTIFCYLHFTTFIFKFQHFFIKGGLILEKLGKQTIKFSNPVTILETARERVKPTMIFL